ncbi:hypothetical protein SAMN05216203_0963 [Marinobacter daqiaonensis]|uniref:Ion transporter n=1 Tax=Marinobacter daqiaonensis TaxID=650891 RepID=A0A1I6H7Q2_9GAMM|nr:hypothetical protein [Marinobacter daqiaonensis]SFR50388.1 hypothetical protein SAMN05216203_0963 [Marinobacter daqiaonensis]
MFTINRENLKRSHQLTWFVIDFVMLGLLIINLVLIIFDSIYSFAGIQDYFQRSMPGFYEVYQPVHRNFILYDLVFVSIFLTEFMVRWAYAVKAGVYARWYFYPFIHWYDLLGCIPTSGMRFLRVLRVISIIYRLHRYGIIDITQTRLFQFVAFYYDAFMEELTDQIVLKVLNGLQYEIKRGSPVVHQVQHGIIYPRRDLLTGWLSDRVADLASEGYVPNRDALRDYLENRINEAIRQNPEISRLKLLPIFGNQVRGTLEEAVGDITSNVIDQVMNDLASSRNHDFIADVVEVLMPAPQAAAAGSPGVTGRPGVESTGPAQVPHRQDNEILLKLMLEIIDVVKEQVRHKRWRERL